MNIHEANDTITEYFTLINKVNSEDIPIEDSIDIMEKIDGMGDCINEALAIIGKFIHIHAGPGSLKAKRVPLNKDGTDTYQYRGNLLEIHTTNRWAINEDMYYSTMDEYVPKDIARLLTNANIRAIRYHSKLYTIGDIFTSKNSGNTGPINSFEINNSSAGNASNIKRDLMLSQVECLPIVKFRDNCVTPIYNTNKR